MAKTNSWGRKYKDIFSVTFKKDEDALKAFLNEQPNPVDYLKMLASKDMNNIAFSMPPQNIINDNQSKQEQTQDKTDTDSSTEEDSQLELSEQAKSKLFKLMEED